MVWPFKKKTQRNQELVKDEQVGQVFLPVSQSALDHSATWLLEASCWAYACTHANGWSVASIGARAEERKGATWVPSNHEGINEFLQFPCGMQNKPPQHSWFDLVYIFATQLFVYGNCYAKPNIVRGGKVLHSLYPILPDNVTVERDANTDYPKKYKLDVGADLSPSQILHIAAPSPFDYTEGSSFLRGAIKAIQVDSIGRERINANMQNRAAPGMVLGLTGVFNATKEQRDKALNFLRENYQAASKDGTPFVIGSDTNIHFPNLPIPDYDAVRKSARDEILSVCRTPPPVVGIYDNATLNNFEQAFKLYFSINTFPTLSVIYNAINAQVIHQVYGKNYRIWYDPTTSEMALILLSARIEAAQGLVAIGYPPNMATAQVGLSMPYVPELDVPLMNLKVAGRNDNSE